MYCPNCGAAAIRGHRYCSSCGFQQPERCSACEAGLLPEAKFCASCGSAQQQSSVATNLSKSPTSLVPSPSTKPNQPSSVRSKLSVKRLYQLKSKDQIDTMTMSPDGCYLATAQISECSYWRVSDGKLQQSWEGFFSAEDIQFSPNSQTLAILSVECELFSITHGEVTLSIPIDAGRIAHKVAYSPDGNIIAIGSYDGSVLLHSTVDGRLQQRFQAQPDRPESLIFAPNGQTLVCATTEGLWMWGLPQSELRYQLSDTGSVVAYRPDSQMIAVGTVTGHVELRDVSSGDLVQTIPAHERWIEDLAWSTDGSLLISGGADQKTHIWSMNDGDLLHTMLSPGGRVRKVAVNPNGSIVTTLHEDGTLYGWQLS